MRQLLRTAAFLVFLRQASEIEPAAELKGSGTLRWRVRLAKAGYRAQSAVIPSGYVRAGCNSVVRDTAVYAIEKRMIEDVEGTLRIAIHTANFDVPRLRQIGVDDVRSGVVLVRRGIVLIAKQFVNGRARGW